jgi:hypothetical protein
MIHQSSPAPPFHSALARLRVTAGGGLLGWALQCAFLGLCAVAAAATATQAPRGVTKRMVQMIWLWGGQAPQTFDVEIFENGIVTIQDTVPGGRVARLRRRDSIRLRDDLASSALVLALGRLKGEGALFGYGKETVSFTVDSRPEAGYFVCSDEPADAAVVKFVGDLNASGASLFGNSFLRIPLPGPCPSMPGPKDTPKQPDATPF